MLNFSGLQTTAARLKTSLLMLAALSTWSGVAAAQPAPPPAGPPDRPAQPAEATQKLPAGQPGPTTSGQAPSEGAPPGSPLDVPPRTDGALPPAGKEAGTTPPPPAAPPRAFANEGGPGPTHEDGPPLAGWNGRFYLRDRNDHFRFYPGAQIQFDLQTAFGPGVDGDARTAGGAGLPPRFVIRRARIELSGELLSRWAYTAQFDFGMRGLSGAENLAVGDEVAAQPSPTIATVVVDYGLCACLHIAFGQMRSPVSMENRSSDPFLPTAERTIATRGLVAPGERETGILVWGDLFDDALSYEAMVAGGDGNNRPQADGSFDFMGRVFVRPFGSIEALEKVQLGISARHGNRDQFGVGYDAYAITTAEGLVLWAPTYTDSLDRKIHVIPTGAQNQIGGELRLPIGPVDLRGELHYVANGTREAVDGFQLSPTNAERLGLLSGYGIIGEATWWAVGDTFISGDPGMQRPPSVNLKKKPDMKKGLALSAVVSAIVADYDANSRGGEDDPLTAGSAGSPATAFDVVQLGLDASYWHTKHVRLALDYSAYLTPGAGVDGGLLRVPGNLGDAGDPDASVVHELNSRIQLWF